MMKKLIKVMTATAIGLCFILSFSTSCKTSTQSGDSPINIKVEGVEFEIIEIEKFLESTEFIFLEKNDSCLLGEWPVFIDLVDEFHVWEPFKQKEILRFDSTGKYLNSIGRIGNGPGEYRNISDALLDDDNVELLMGSTSSARTDIMRYSKSGKFIERQSFADISPSSFAKLPTNSEYLFYYLHVLRIMMRSTSFI